MGGIEEKNNRFSLTTETGREETGEKVGDDIKSRPAN